MHPKNIHKNCRSKSLYHNFVLLITKLGRGWQGRLWARQNTAHEGRLEEFHVKTQLQQKSSAPRKRTGDGGLEVEAGLKENTYKRMLTPLFSIDVKVEYVYIKSKFSKHVFFRPNKCHESIISIQKLPATPVPK